jgi:hypothetical protein
MRMIRAPPSWCILRHKSEQQATKRGDEHKVVLETQVIGKL